MFYATKYISNIIISGFFTLKVLEKFDLFFCASIFH
jgi:hypothetical protein